MPNTQCNDTDVLCALNCAEAQIPTVRFDDCAPEINESEIEWIAVARSDAADFTDIEDSTQWTARIAQNAAAPLAGNVLATPVNAAFTAGTGTLAAGTYYYRVSAINQYGETLPSTETSFAAAAGTGVNVNWGSVTGATGYKVYGRSTGAELLIATVGAVTTYLDNGSVTPAGAMPTVNTTATPSQDDTIRMIRVIGDKPAPELQNRTVSGGRSLQTAKNHTINAEIDETNIDNYEFVRSTSCNPTYKVWYVTKARLVYGGICGIPAQVIFNLIQNRGDGEIEKYVGTVTWKDRHDPPRANFPLAGVVTF